MDLPVLLHLLAKIAFAKLPDSGVRGISSFGSLSLFCRGLALSNLRGQIIAHGA